MPILLEEKNCRKLGGIPLSPTECRVTKELVRNIASKIPLDEYGKSYLNALSYTPNDERAIITQALYIASNAYPKTQEEKLALQQLSNLRIGKPLPLKLSEKPPTVMDEIEAGRISDSFERFTETKARDYSEKEEECFDAEDDPLYHYENLDLREKAKKLREYFVNKKFDVDEYERELEKLKEIMKKTTNILPSLLDTANLWWVASVYFNKYVPEEEKRKFPLLSDANKIEKKIDKLEEKARENLEKEGIISECNKFFEQEDKYKINLDDFKRFSKTYNYPLDKVLAANPWSEDVLSEDAKKAIEEAEKKIKII